jgi:hypothetical protein
MLAGACLLPGCGKDKGSTTKWEPEAALLEKLQPETEVEAYRVRPPKGYTMTATPAPNGKAYAWAGAPRANGVTPSFTVLVMTVPQREATISAEDFVGKMLEGVKKRRDGWQQSATERGQVNGLEFARTRWSGTEPTKGWKMHGFSYGFKDGNTYVQLASQDAEPDHEAPLKLAEAAALTFRKP